MLHSILAIVCARDYHRNQFPIAPAEFTMRMHGSFVELKVRRQNPGLDAMDLKDVCHSTGLPPSIFINSMKIAAQFGLFNDFYPCHGSRPERA
jgi:hypothetical protein